MNTYTSTFHSRCPSNGARIFYTWTLRTNETVRVERINDLLDSLSSGFHEDFAEKLQTSFGGEQTLVAEHHGVCIETKRHEKDSALMRNGYF